MKKIIQFKNISKTFQHQKIIDQFNLAIEEKDFLCIVGTSGSGKTTLLKMINGLVTPDSGEICIHHQNIQTLDLIALRRKIGYVIQENGLFPHMTVKENIGFVPMLEKRTVDIQKLIQLVQLDASMLEKYPDQLSGGQKQRVGLARAYANQPDILLMDEPFGALDSITRKQLQQDLKRMHLETNVTIVFITHDIQEACALATKILVLHEGKIEQLDTPEKMIAQPKTAFVRKLIQS